MAVALWVGAMVFFLVVLGPSANALEPRIAIQTLNRGRIGFELLSWIAIALLLLTGVFNLLQRLSISTLATREFYSVILTIKLFVFGAMLAHHLLQTFRYAPAIARLTSELPELPNHWPEGLLGQWRRWFLLLKINAALGPIAILLGLNLVKV
ncbi:MAG TPA: CopD family protein [Candidatus Binatia bacterium]|nr:CopD family protein [Candidatus Binatia bacterium]